MVVSDTPAARASSHLYIALYGGLLADESFIVVRVWMVVDASLCFDDFVVLEECVFAR